MVSLLGDGKSADLHSLAECLAEKYGYANVEELKKDGKGRFSLVENGVLDKPCARLLLANVGSRVSLGA